MMLLWLTFFKRTFHFQNNNLFCFSNNWVYIGDLKHHFMSTSRDTHVLQKLTPLPRLWLLEIRIRAALATTPVAAPGQGSATGPSLSGDCQHVIACLGLPLLTTDLHPSPVLSQRGMSDAQGWSCPGVPGCPALDWGGGTGPVWQAMPWPTQGRLQYCWYPARGGLQPLWCPDTSLSMNHRDVFSDCRFAHWVTCTTTPVFAL